MSAMQTAPERGAQAKRDRWRRNASVAVARRLVDVSDWCMRRAHELDPGTRGPDFPRRSLHMGLMLGAERYAEALPYGSCDVNDLAYAGDLLGVCPGELWGRIEAARR